MTIVLTGGGTGGHITPTLAVAHELKRLKPDCRIVYVIERSARFGELVSADPNVDEVRFIFAGKLRRYHGESWLRRLTDVKTIVLNLRDLFLLLLGFAQSLWLIARVKPAAVFVKGGYVGLPAGAAAAFWRRPIITHDSDTVPGLTNRIVARWARLMTTAFSAEMYAYPPAKVRYVGVPVDEIFRPLTLAQQRALRERIGMIPDAQVVLVTGGSLGAVRLNQAVAAIVPKLLEKYPKLYIIHQTGAKSGTLYGADVDKRRLVAREFFKPLADYSGAADIVIARPGATTMAELGAQDKACIVVPSPFLAGGHQIKNAEHLAEQGAVIAVEEGASLSERLSRAVEAWLDHPEQARATADKLHQLVKPGAARELAMLLLEQAKP
jgi:UDP-N-acetylglucosamine--N-acetylmuramyl-(pentapeptide) pyrophosphoryl-undecaprenol N-acetylglucosamine transferase